MLIGIDPLLGPETLALLRAMGHGDEMVLVDANFPAARLARTLVRLDGVGIGRVLEAVLSVLPLDEAEPDPALGMRPDTSDPALSAARVEMQAILNRRPPPRLPIALLDRHAFYERASRAYGIIATGDRRLFANLILRKGTIALPTEAR